MRTFPDASEEVADAGTSAPGADGHTHESACLNCGTKLIGEHCHACGQRAHVHRTLGAFFHDLLHGVLHFEGKTWRTLPMLVWRPGELTRRYIDGERAQFVSPIALFLFSVFLMFAVFSSVGSPIPSETAAQIQTGMAKNVQVARQRVGELERQRDGLAAAGQPTREAEAQIEAGRQELSLLEQTQREGLLVGFGHRIVDDLPEGFWKKAVQKFNDDPALTLYKLQANAYKFSWLMIPIVVPLVWLLFLWRRQHWQLYDHTVFVTYSLSFQTFTLIGFAMLVWMGVPLLPLLLALALITSIHLEWQLRAAYRLNWLSAFWRMLALSLLIGVALVLFVLALIAIGATG